MSLQPRACLDPRRRHWLAAALLGCAGVGRVQAQDEPSALTRIKKRGSLSVALYQAMPPFHVEGKGIDVDLARALAGKLGVELSPLPFAADENMDDDLRNMVWRGHYLGHGPADVLLHVPVDRPLMAGNPRVQIFGPYYREQVMLARERSKFPELVSLEALGTGAIAVPGQTLAGWLMLGAESGRYRPQLKTSWRDGTEAAAALARGEVVAAAGQASELESVLSADERFVIEPLPLPQVRQGWVVGMAVKKSSVDLAQALQAALNELVSAGSLREMFAKRGVRWRQP